MFFGPHTVSHPDMSSLEPEELEFESGQFKEVQLGILRCLDLDEESTLPSELSKGTKSYKQFKEETKYAGTTARSQGAVCDG
jgi:hypothetical protein